MHLFTEPAHRVPPCYQQAGTTCCPYPTPPHPLPPHPSPPPSRPSSTYCTHAVHTRLSHYGTGRSFNYWPKQRLAWHCRTTSERVCVLGYACVCVCVSVCVSVCVCVCHGADEIGNFSPPLFSLFPFSPFIPFIFLKLKFGKRVCRGESRAE